MKGYIIYTIFVHSTDLLTSANLYSTITLMATIAYINTDYLHNITTKY